MAKLQGKYESVIIISLKLSEEEIKAAVAKITDLISANGTLEKVDEWGKRRLAYAINYETEGYYVQFDFTSAPDFLAELDRIYGITDGIIRSLTINLDE
ncbi:MAG: 30S ribosomal protein S6 [Oscillospiraceae bacterium]|nr:30S ribosomal protein S6 [Oscillospiraceae bacterium]